MLFGNQGLRPEIALPHSFQGLNPSLSSKQAKANSVRSLSGGDEA